MFNLLNNLNILEVLRVGLAGLCFLLSVLSFWLIQREQQRASSPRKGILRAIYTFTAVNFLTGVLVAAAGYLSPEQHAMAAEELSAKTYMTDNLSFLVDFTKWSEQTHGPVEITRTDNIRKVARTRADYVIPYFTTATSDDAISAKFLSYSRLPDFVPDERPEFAGKHFLYKIPFGDQPANSTESVSTMFTFPAGFKDPAKEWWQASVAYPSRIVSVVIRFLDSKPCKKIQAFRMKGIRGDKELLNNNRPIRSNGGAIVNWVGLNVDGDTRIEFDWEW
jgi:hypothetical protein